MIYVFDVDMTLVESDCAMTEDMAQVFRRAMDGATYYFCSGSNYEKMCSQLPQDICDNAAGLFPCMGGQFWKGGTAIYRRQFTWPEGLRDDLERILAESPYPQEHRTSDHIQDRESMVCFSVVGKAAVGEERHRYTAYDDEVGEREKFAAELREKYPQLAVMIGGKVSVDISEPGNDKSQVLTVLREYSDEPIMFFGDRMFEGGNDKPLADALAREGNGNKSVTVTTPEDTLRILTQMTEERAAS